jgi:chromosome segregation ATPase
LALAAQDNQRRVPDEAPNASHTLNSPADNEQKQALFELRREHYTLLTDKRRLELENQMLRATGDGGE